MKKITLFLITLLFISALPAQAAVEKKDRLWQDETVYSIMIDRFNNGDRNNDIDANAKDPNVYNGGDFQGIIDKLDYIQDMGFTAIRLTPIFDNTKNGYHGYWVNDFYKTDEHFGSMKTFQKLVKEAHKRKIKVLMDFVTNNTALTHPWVKDSSKQDWFHQQQEISDWNNQQELENGWVDGLPDLNQDNPEVKKYLIDAAKWWIKKTGVDGYSLPQINHVPVSFWTDFSNEVKKEKKGFLLIGIPAENAVLDVNKYHGAGIDSVFDYSQNEKLRKAFATTNQSFSPINSDFYSSQKKAGLMANFLDNEYTTRFTNDIVDKRQFPGSRWKTALTYLYTTPGIPIFYYGTEIALVGGDIPDNRRQMNFRTEKELIDYITKLTEQRNQLASLTRGTMEVLYDKDGMIVYKRVYKGETSVVAINNSTESQKVVLTDKQLADNKELRGLLAGDIVRSRDHQYILIVDRDNSEIYVLTEKSGIKISLIVSLIIVYILVGIFLYFLIKRRKTNKIE
ncbi:alpha-amylase domain protein [Neobacillus bataviensis LMG 21833]|uniref:alpha-amylase n=1 Tax=Neobacillus bataviensis LMG 21833 TaxID=1117379 RepID=K6EA75_9BACI|nr:alpha-amylase family glycosyl hydrolase [Neobacillus bataviensis]EKN70296.1 alpha-amylase domain protein [Neobacillus bataviensis LMG 21833]